MLNGVGWIHAQLGDYEQALEFCEQALSMYRGRGDPLNEAATWDSMGYALLHLGRLDEAIGCLRTALRHHRGLRPGYYQTTMLVHLGDAYHAAGDLGLARQAWQDALAILEDLNHSDADQVRARLHGQATARSRHPRRPGRVSAGRPRCGGPRGRRLTYRPLTALPGRYRPVAHFKSAPTPPGAPPCRGRLRTAPAPDLPASVQEAGGSPASLSSRLGGPAHQALRPGRRLPPAAPRPAPGRARSAAA